MAYPKSQPLSDKSEFKLEQAGEVPGGPVVRTWCFHCQGPDSIPGRGSKIPQAAWHGQNNKKKSYLKEQQQQKLEWAGSRFFYLNLYILLLPSVTQNHFVCLKTKARRRKTLHPTDVLRELDSLKVSKVLKRASGSCFSIYSQETGL